MVTMFLLMNIKNLFIWICSLPMSILNFTCLDQNINNNQKVAAHLYNLQK